MSTIQSWRHQKVPTLYPALDLVGPAGAERIRNSVLTTLRGARYKLKERRSGVVDARWVSGLKDALDWLAGNGGATRTRLRVEIVGPDRVRIQLRGVESSEEGRLLDVLNRVLSEAQAHGPVHAGPWYRP